MWIPWLCLACWASAVEYELSGSYEHFERGNEPEGLARLQQFVKEHTPPGQPPRMTREIKAEFEKLHGPIAGVLKQDLWSKGDKFDREFKVWVRGNAWCIHTRRPDSEPKTGWEHGMVDGKELTITLLTDGGGGMGMVGYRSQPVPHSLWDFGVPIVWMMTASGGYFDTLTNNLVWPSHMLISGARPGQPEVDYRQPCIITRRDAKPGLPMALTFRTGDGQTNASYRAIGFRELGGLSLPSGFVWEQYGGLVPVPGGQYLRVDNRIVARITNFVAVCTRKDLRPRVLPNMGVADYRVKQPTNQMAAATTNPAVAVSTKGYVVRDGKWPSAAKAQDLVDGRKRTSKDWIWAAVLAVVLLGGAVAWLRWRARPCVPPRRPPPPPADAPSP